MVAVMNSFCSTTFPVPDTCQVPFQGLKVCSSILWVPSCNACHLPTVDKRIKMLLEALGNCSSLLLLLVMKSSQTVFLSRALYICRQHMEYLLVFAIRMSIPIRNFIKNCFFAGLTHVVSQPEAFLRLVLNPWPKENNVVYNHQAGTQRWAISYCSSLWPTHKQEVAIFLPHTGSKPQSVTVTLHPAYPASKGFCVQEVEWCSFSLLKAYELKIKVNILWVLFLLWKKNHIRIHQTDWERSYKIMTKAFQLS